MQRCRRSSGSREERRHHEQRDSSFPTFTGVELCEGPEQDRDQREGHAGNDRQVRGLPTVGSGHVSPLLQAGRVHLHCGVAECARQQERHAGPSHDPGCGPGVDGRPASCIPRCSGGQRAAQPGVDRRRVPPPDAQRQRRAEHQERRPLSGGEGQHGQSRCWSAATACSGSGHRCRVPALPPLNAPSSFPRFCRYIN